MIGYITFRLLPAVAALLGVTYLAFVVFKPDIKKRILSRHKDLLHQRIYSTRFLVACSLVTIFLLLSILIDFYQATRNPSNFVVSFLSVVSIVAASCGLYLGSGVFRAKR